MKLCLVLQNFLYALQLVSVLCVDPDFVGHDSMTLFDRHDSTERLPSFLFSPTEKDKFLYANEKNIYYDPDYLSGLTHARLCFFPTTFLEIAVFN